LGAGRAGARLIALAALACACAHRKPLQANATTNPGIFHRVNSGETLWRISRAYDVPLETLLSENALPDPSRLDEGALLFIPGARRPLEVNNVHIPDGEVNTVHLRGRRSPALIPRAGGRPLDPACRGEPLAWPAQGVLISSYGVRERDHHDGIDLAAPEGTPVRAAGDGVVLFSGEQRGYGNIVLLAHDNDLVTVYAHNAENLVSRGDRVSRGREIARIGHTGRATGPHLHFEVRVAARARDPLGFLR
jgi:hypothetical protein